MNYFGSKLEITGQVQYIGEGEDPKNNIGFQAWAKAFKEVYGQPDRLNPEDQLSGDSGYLICDSRICDNK